MNEKIKSIIASKDAHFIFEFARDVQGLTKENIDELVKAIILTENVSYIFKFARDFKFLTKENMDDIKNAILKTKNLRYIARYLIVTKDIVLINEIFGSFEKFIMYVTYNLNFKIEIELNEKEFRNFLRQFPEYNCKDFENNINNCINQKPVLKVKKKK